MILEKFEKYLRISGFYSLPSGYAEFPVFVKMEQGFVNALQLVDYEKGLYLSSDHYEEVKEAVHKTFSSRNMEVHIMSLVIGEDFNKARALVKDERFAWFINPATNEFLIEDDRIEDFYGLKGDIRKFLNEFDDEPDPDDEYRSEEEMSHFGNRCKYAFMDAPKITVCLVAINIFVYILCRFYGGFIYEKGQLGLVYIREKEYYRLITSMFLHANLQHISSNMILLYFMGDMLERILKKSEYIFVFLLSGIIGNVVSCIYEYTSQLSFTSIGASGAIYGLIGCLFFRVIRQKPKLEISVPRMLVMVAYCIFSTFTEADINIAAHMGGLVAGFFIAWFISLRRQKA